jgi:hypothetical protein
MREAINREAIERVLAEGLAKATSEEQALFARAAVEPMKWRLSPWGDEGGDFSVVALMEDRVLWYNDIEEGFNVSHFVERGTIPSNESWCNQDELRWALPALMGERQSKAAATAFVEAPELRRGCGICA